MPMIRFSLAVLAALSLALAPAAEAQSQRRQLLEYPSIHHPTVGMRGMVVSQNAIASEVGAEILRKGGNAVDAAVAVGFALAVTLPRAGNIGGDGFMLAHIAGTGETVVIDFRSVAPAAARLEMFVDDKGEETPVASRGYRASAVPGTVAGLELAHRRYGKLPWKDVVTPAWRLAAEGIVLTPDEAFVFSWARERMTESVAGQRTFYKPGGELYRAGEVLKQPDLAWSLRQIADHGADAFYRGEIARRFAADMKANKGLITLEDLAAYRPVVREPLVGTYRGYTVATTPPASSGGATLLQMLNILETFDLKALGGAGSSGALHVMAEAMKLAYADRYRHLGDTDFVKVPLRGFTSKAYGAQQASRIDVNRAKSAKSLGAGDPWKYESPSTTHFSIADSAGNAVSTTYTLGADFGSGVMVEGTGFVLNNQMNNYSHEQAVEAARQGRASPPNAMAPGKRMLSTMMPTLVFKDGKPWVVTGTPGGSTIIDTVLQVIVNVIDFDLNIAEATHQPRIFQAATDTLEVEPNFNPDTVAALRARGHAVKSSETMGSAQSIMIDKGLYLGGADPRRPGALAVAP
ncbi:MAG: gamma-glutamyltransferase [Pseudomonadota bacterium]|jgi:gamma-glutamyltranspeptidase/glutathione hydrolase